ncbi:Stp1/IreP family PP2C-type Ser/Thr phosphatase [bacterium]|nr:Stp1/IreP family PP2C-type Ser/Thr phosphatase [bacterium]
MKYAAISHTGQKRKTNQDNYGILETIKLFTVADGMGGHRGGESASQIAVSEITNFFKVGDTLDITQTELDLDPEKQRLRNLKQAARQANRSILREAKINPEKAGMGTTIVMLQLFEDKAFVAHVGDSRLYRLRKNSIRQITKDHSRLQELIDTKQVTPEEVENYPFKNIITRALGSGPDIEVDLAMFPFSARDAFLLCTDGITTVLSDDELISVISGSNADPEKALTSLAELVEQKGSPDNYTAILIIGDDFMEDTDPDFQEDTGPIEVHFEKNASSQSADVVLPVQPSQEHPGGPDSSDQAGFDWSDRLSVAESEQGPHASSAGPELLGPEAILAGKVDKVASTLVSNEGLLEEKLKTTPQYMTNSRKYLIVVLLLLGLYLTLCTVNFATYWVQYDSECNSLQIMRGAFHPYDKKEITTVKVVPDELWMMMIQDQEMKSSLNRGRSFFRYRDLNKFLARLMLDIGLRYMDQEGLKERLVAVDLFKRGRQYGRYEQFTENLVTAMTKIGQVYDTNDDLNNALSYYQEALAIDSDNQNLQDRIERVMMRMKPDLSEETDLSEGVALSDDDQSSPETKQSGPDTQL